MSKIAFFKPRKTIEAEVNLAEFIRFCKEELTVFGADLVWREQHWKNAGVSFSNLDQKSRIPDPKNVLVSPFIDFAKAYLRYQQGQKPTKTKGEIPAFKCLERALLEENGKADILYLTASTLDRASVLAAEYFSAAVAYQIGGQLKKIADFVSDNGLIPTPIDWKNPHKRIRDTVRTGAKAKAEREKNCPMRMLLTLWLKSLRATRNMIGMFLLLALSLCLSAALVELEKCYPFGWIVKCTKRSVTAKKPMDCAFNLAKVQPPK